MSYFVGDPFIEWEEANSAREEYPEEDLLAIFHAVERTQSVEDLKTSVTAALVSQYDFDMDEAEELISESQSKNPDIWHENADVKILAKHLAGEDDDD